MKKQKNKHIIDSSFWQKVKNIGYIFAIIGGGYWAGYYIHEKKSSVELHEREMQMYNLHYQIEEGYKNEIRQLEADKRELEKEIYQLRQENIQLNNNNHEQGNTNKN